MDRRRFLTVIGTGMVAASLLVACGGSPASPTAAPAKPAESKPAESKPAEAKPAESKPAESKPAESKPASGSSAVVIDVPLFKDAKPLASNDPMASAIETMKQQLKNQPDANLTVEAYALPTGATFDQVKQYYTDELGKRGWKSGATGGQAAGQPGTGAVAWIKDDKLVVTVMVMPNPTQSGSSLMLLAQGSRK